MSVIQDGAKDTLPAIMSVLRVVSGDFCATLYIVMRCENATNGLILNKLYFLNSKEKYPRRNISRPVHNLFSIICKHISLPNHPVGTVTFQSRAGPIFFTVSE
jgi:hypothetical protein